MWRCSHQSNTEFYGDAYDEANDQLIEWNGALRWIKSTDDLFTEAEQRNGHATRYPINKNTQPLDLFQPLQPGLLKIHQRLKKAFDPENILNPGRLYSDV